MSSTQDNIEEIENIDQAAWVPQGSEVVPAAALLNGYTKAEGKRFLTVDTPLIDRLLSNEKIDPSHHETALRLVKLFRSGTSKQGYATMKIFSSTPGFDNSDYCPMTIFVRATRELKGTQIYWIRVICGLQSASYEKCATSADLIRDALEAVETKLQDQKTDESSEPYHEDLD